jgi:hypothetical protein
LSLGNQHPEISDHLTASAASSAARSITRSAPPRLGANIARKWCQQTFFLGLVVFASGDSIPAYFLTKKHVALIGTTSCA